MTAKSDRVKKLLDDPDLQEAFNNVREAIFKGWSQCKPSDHELKEEWHRRLFTLDSIERNLKVAIQEGKLEDFMAAEQEREQKIWKKINPLTRT